MVITTASKLIIAEDEIKDLTLQLEKEQLYSLDLEKQLAEAHVAINRWHDTCTRLEALVREVESIRLILQDRKPWWKFW